ncbi:unnamed protein product [Malus baccata var. baccata]
MSKRIKDNEADIRSGPSSNQQTNSAERVLPQQQQQQAYQVHKVGEPAKPQLFEEFSAIMKETFFSDEPLRAFKDQTKRRKLVLGLQALFPIFGWVRDYNLSKLRGDDLGYAKLANLPSENGLYSSFVPPLIYAFMGSSRDIAIGPVAVVSLLLGSLVQNEVDYKTDADDYLRLMLTATFFAGVTQLTLGFLRLGFLIDFLSHASIVGFMGGAAITISLQQLKGLLGIKIFTKKPDIVSVMRSVFSAVHHGWNWQTILIGVSFLAFLLLTKYIGKKNKKLFWVPAIAPLISVILSTFFVYITRADKKGVAIEGVAIARTFAGIKDYEVDGNKEMVAMGTMNIIGSFTSCYVATGSFSRSAINYMAGCHTAVSNIVMSLVVLLTLELITPIFKYTPNAILASIIISAVLGLIDFEAMKLIWKIDKFDFVACMGAFFGVVFISVEIGLLLAVSISFAKILLQVTRPRTTLLGKLPRTNVYRNIQQYPHATQIPGILIIRVDSAIYFSNSNYIKERILRWVTDEEEQLKEKSLPKIEYLIVEMSPVIDIDTSGIHALEELYRSLQKRKIELALANPGTVVIDKIHASEFVDLIGKGKIFLSVADAILTFAPHHEEP